jgi:hypothetical protein
VRALGLLSSNATTGVNERSSAAALASAPKTTSAQESSMTDRDIRAALNQHWAASDANDFELEHQIYREDAVLEYPQSGERIRGRSLDDPMNYSEVLYASHVLERPPSRIRRQRLGGGQKAGLTLCHNALDRKLQYY